MAEKKLDRIALPVLLALSAAHFLNDLLQSTVAATYPLLKADLDLSFAQIGSITLVYQISASVFQPVVGMLFDRRPYRRTLMLATLFTCLGIAGLALSPSLAAVYASVFVVGTGSSILHPEASRITSLASGGKRGLAQSIFQVGGNFGGSVGPLLIALIVAPFGRSHLLWFLLFSALAFAVTSYISSWFRRFLSSHGNNSRVLVWRPRPFGKGKTAAVVGLICVLIISKYLYLESLRSYYTFYLIDKFGVSIPASQVCLFVFLFATAAGTLVGGPVGDRIGRKWVILISILGTAPFALALPHAGFAATLVLSFCAGFIISSAFPAILLYAQELLPNRLGLVSGLFFGFAFGMGGISSALLGSLIDAYGLATVYRLVAFSPLIGLVAVFLPDLKVSRKSSSSKEGE